MNRTTLLLALILPLAACQATRDTHQAAAPASSTGNNFAQHTSRAYDIQSRQFQQEPPYGDRSDTQ